MRLLVVERDGNRRTRAGVRVCVRRQWNGGCGSRHYAAGEGRFVRKAVSIMWSAAEKFAADDGWAIASYIGLTLLMSLFPFLIFVAAVAGFLGSAELAKEAAKLIFTEWPDAVARPIAQEVENVLTAPRGGLLTLGAVLSFYFASSAIEALRVGLNRAYGLIEKRPWWMLQTAVARARAGRLAGAAGAGFPGRARAADSRRALGLDPVDRRGVQFPELCAPGCRRFHARGVAVSGPQDPAGAPAEVRRPPSGRRPDLFRQHRVRRSVRGLSEPVCPQLHFDLRRPRLGDDCARLSLLGRAAVRLRRRAQRGDHAGPRPKRST